MPTSYDYRRRIGSFTRSAGVNVSFQQSGDLFQVTNPTTLGVAVDVTNPGTAAVTRTLNYIPTGIVVTAILNVGLELTTNRACLYLSALTTTDVAVGDEISSPMGYEIQQGVNGAMAGYRVLTNTSAQIRSRIGVSDAGTRYAIQVTAWEDRRGQDD